MDDTNLPALAPLDRVLEQVTPLRLAMGLGALSLFAILVGTCAAYGDAPELPPPIPAAPPIETETVLSYRYKETFYRALVDEDTDRLKIGRMDLASLGQPNVHRVEFTGSQRLPVGGTLSTESLNLKVTRQRVWVGEEGQSVRAPHVVLRITNLTGHHLAFNVRTKDRAPCRDKGVLSHNALALAPGQQVSRTECLVRSGAAVTVQRVEVMQLTALGYHYVSRLDPDRLQLDPRVTDGHDYAGLEPCALLPWRAIRDALEKGAARWSDVIDFYSRHNCDEYTFAVGYRWSEDGPDRLPVRPPSDSGAR